MKKYILNKLPVKTTNNFKINDLEIELDIPKLNNNNEYEITDIKDIIITKKIVNKKLTTKVGLEFNKYLDIKIVIPKNKVIDDTIYINYNFSIIYPSFSFIIISAFKAVNLSFKKFIYIVSSSSFTSSSHNLPAISALATGRS